MRHKIRRFIKLLSLLLFAFALTIASCNQIETQELGAETGSQLPPSSECRVIRHKMGEVCIPSEPQRVVALNSAGIPDSLLALGIKPIGMTYISHSGRKLFHGLSAGDVADIELVGTNAQPSIEKILELKPDLILAPNTNGEPIYAQLSKIAPTVILEGDELTFSLKESFRTIAETLGREDKAEQVLNQYQEQVESVQALLAEKLGSIEVAFVIYNGGEFYVPASSATFFQVLDDVGVDVKPVFLEKNEWFPISIEVIEEYDSDVLFILNPDDQPISYFLQNPLISQLKSAQNNQVHVVDVINWVPYGPLGMRKLLDELPEYLLQADEL